MGGYDSPVVSSSYHENLIRHSFSFWQWRLYKDQDFLEVFLFKGALSVLLARSISNSKQKHSILRTKSRNQVEMKTIVQSACTKWLLRQLQLLVPPMTTTERFLLRDFFDRCLSVEVLKGRYFLQHSNDNTA